MRGGSSLLLHPKGIKKTDINRLSGLNFLSFGANDGSPLSKLCPVDDDLSILR